MGAYAESTRRDYAIVSAKMSIQDVVQLANDPQAAFSTVSKQRNLGSLSDRWANRIEVATKELSGKEAKEKE